MPLVIIEGVFMGAEPKTSTFEGNTRTSIYVDVYQPKAEGEKTVQLKTDDLSLLNVFTKEYAMGSLITCEASVNAYKNKAYYKLLKLKTPETIK
jgi:hypothetical protein